MYGKIDHWRAHASNETNQFLKPDSHMLIADQIAMYLEDRDRRQLPQFSQDLFCRGEGDQETFQKEIEKFDHREVSTNYSSNKSLVHGHSDSVLRLHVGSKEPVRSESVAHILTSSSSLKISKLTSKMRALEKVALKHRRGDFGMPEKDFLELVFCPYRGQGQKDKSDLREYLNFRQQIEVPLDHLELPMVALGNSRKHIQSRTGGINRSKPLDSRDDDYQVNLDSPEEEFRNLDCSKYTDLFGSITSMKKESRKILSPVQEKHAHIQEPLGIKRAQKPKLTAVLEPQGPRALSPT